MSDRTRCRLMYSVWFHLQRRRPRRGVLIARCCIRCHGSRCASWRRDGCWKTAGVIWRHDEMVDDHAARPCRRREIPHVLVGSQTRLVEAYLMRVGYDAVVFADGGSSDTNEKGGSGRKNGTEDGSECRRRTCSSQTRRQTKTNTRRSGLESTGSMGGPRGMEEEGKDGLRSWGVVGGNVGDGFCKLGSMYCFGCSPVHMR